MSPDHKQKVYLGVFGVGEDNHHNIFTIQGQGQRETSYSTQFCTWLNMSTYIDTNYAGMVIRFIQNLY